ncbi:MAG: hypothetical protein CYPHOPRED_003908, partial [Cyphobasidiales sp. Tagirdzhanova-0007]
ASQQQIKIGWIDDVMEEHFQKKGKSLFQSLATDLNSYLYLGFQRHQDPGLHELGWRTFLRRALLNGRVVADSNLSVMRIMFSPGKVNRTFDLTLDSSEDPECVILRQHWDMKAWEQRATLVGQAVGPVIKARYGEDASKHNLGTSPV